MIVSKHAQGTPGWHRDRAGCITASMFHLTRVRIGGLDEKQARFVELRRGGMSEPDAMAGAGYKTKPRAEVIERALAGLPVGDFSDAAKAYAFRLGVERICKVPLDEGHETWQMERGHEMEPDARRIRESRTGAFVDLAGFVMTDDGKFGASADGFIGEDEGDEYKCFVSPVKLRRILLSDDISGEIDQCDGGMWITGRRRWNLHLYGPALAPLGLDLVSFTIDRDDDRIEALEADLVEFERLVTSYETQLRARAERSPIVIVEAMQKVHAAAAAARVATERAAEAAVAAPPPAPRAGLHLPKTLFKPVTAPEVA